MEARRKDILIEPLKPDEYVSTIVLFLITVVIAEFVTDFSLIVVYTGATAGSLVALIIPGILYIIMKRK
jgi:hypothetical protein